MNASSLIGSLRLKTDQARRRANTEMLVWSTADHSSAWEAQRRWLLQATAETLMIPRHPHNKRLEFRMGSESVN
jgi:hypothetical protein